MGEHYLLNERQAESRAVRLGGEKREKDFSKKFLRNAMARVFDEDADVSTIRRCLYNNRDGP
jgi:hypothetical protein